MALFNTRINVKESGASEGDVSSLDFQDNLDLAVSGETAEIDATGGAATIDHTVVGGTTTIRKSASETLASSTTVQADDHLTVNVVSGRSYVWELFFFGDTDNASGLKARMGGTATGSVNIMVYVMDGYSGITDADMQASFSSFPTDTETVVPALAGNAQSAHFWGDLECSGDGSFRLEWAQVSSSVDVSRIHEGAYFRITRTA